MDLYSKLSSSMDELSATFTARMRQYDVELKNAAEGEGTHKSLASLSSEFAEFKDFILKTIGTMKSQMELLLTAVDRHEMSSRKKVLLLHGLKEENSDCTTQIVNVLSSKIKISNISAKDIKLCHRLGVDTKNPRPFLIRFSSLDVRRDVWNKKTMLKGSGLTLSEFLTKPRHEVFMSARKHFGVTNCWTSDGKIVILFPNGRRRRIESSSELHKLILEHPATQSSSASGVVSDSKKQPTISKPPSAQEKRTRKPLK